ncbi:MAG: prolyl oligopeptidase family serine peptidase, partial [Myxococcota bacterium]
AAVGDTKRRTGDDIVAAAEFLVESGRARPGRDIALMGYSGGGYAAALATLMRPDLWAASMPIVGVHDIVGSPNYTYGEGWASDFGRANPRLDPEDEDPIENQSPYHMALDGGFFPPTLIWHGRMDSRVEVAHSDKLAAAMQENNRGNSPILYYSPPYQGHGLPVRHDEYARVLATQVAFLMHMTGLELNSSSNSAVDDTP